MKKQELKQPDQVQVAIERGLQEVNNNRGPIALALGVIVLLTVVGTSLGRQGELQLEKYNQTFLHASDALTKARQLSDGPERAKSVADAKQTLIELYDETVGEDLHPFVIAKLADLAAGEGDYQTAIGYANELVASSDEPELKNAAYYRLMKLYLAAYNVPQAITTGREALENTDGAFTPLIQEEIKRLQGGTLNAALTQQLKDAELTKQKARD